MTRRSTYQTRQMKELREFLASTDGKHVTVKDICRYFDEAGRPVGTATVYRNLEKLVEEGIVAKYSADPSDSACFSYIGSGEECCHPVCFHLKCQKCGRLIHLECDEITRLSEHMLRAHGFELNPVRTVFYGLCEDCR
ncbi:MAG: transcriptional repressor [Anaerovoracaceae bacterium]|nr:transcriptional repressor [Anaerovoracaceae bacterium]